jgi:hypothetical protein
MFDLRAWLQSARILTLGGIVGGALGAVVYFCFPSHFADVNPYGLIGVCIAVGTAVQRAVESIYQPIIRFIKFREELLELGIMRDRGEINQQTYQRVVNRLVERRFLPK